MSSDWPQALRPSARYPGWTRQHAGGFGVGNDDGEAGPVGSSAFGKRRTQTKSTLRNSQAVSGRTGGYSGRGSPEGREMGMSHGKYAKKQTDKERPGLGRETAARTM